MASTSERSSAGQGPKTTSLTVEIPSWAWDPAGSVFATVEDRMRIVIDLGVRNVAEGGGPFAAAVFAADGTFIAPGINRVTLASAPIAHAEIVAIGLAAQTLGSWDIAALGSFELVSSTEPCAMCLGAVPWAGVVHLVCGARDSDASAVGFNEGHKPTDWVSNLESAGIQVTQDVMRDEATGLLQGYAADGGAIYNGRS